jgi:hypothetical protein
LKAHISEDLLRNRLLSRVLSANPLDLAHSQLAVNTDVSDEVTTRSAHNDKYHLFSALEHPIFHICTGEINTHDFKFYR